MKLVTQLLVVLFWILVAIAATLVVTKVFVPAVQAQTAPRNAPTTTQPQPAAIKPAPDPVNGYLALYDTNHDGKIDAQELKRMAVLDPAAWKIASAFVDSRGQLGVDEIAAWRAFLRAKK